MEVGKKEKLNLNTLYLVVFAVLIFFIDIVNPMKHRLYSLESFLLPLSYYGFEKGSSVKNSIDFFSTYVEAEDTIEGLNQKISQQELLVNQYYLLNEKYQSLLEHSKTKDRKYGYIQAFAYYPEDGSSIVLNVGSEQGIIEGDVVVIGDIYVGTVTQVSKESSKVITPENSQSSLEVKVIKKNGKQNIKGVVIGRDFKMILENVLSKSTISNGDIVLVSDKKIGGNLVLGIVDNLSVDDAATVVNAEVVSAVDILKYNFVFIRK